MTQPERIGRYEIKQVLGRGGMATVYLGHDPRFRRDVAIKVLPRQFTHDPLFRIRFEREAQTIAALEHPAIVPVHDYGEDDEQPYLVMRYMPGGSLAERLQDGPIPLLETAKILGRIAGALDLAHSQGVIHRDLKPGNILFDQYGEAFLADFGIAKMAEATAALTGSALIGTPAYMSPEQIRGLEVDSRSDIYTLGVILFEMLTGQQPFEASTPIAVAFKHVNDPVPSIRSRRADLNQGLQSAIDRAMAKDANGRYQTASDLAGNIDEITAGKALPDEHQQLPTPTEPEIKPIESEPLEPTEVLPLPDEATAIPATPDQLASSSPPELQPVKPALVPPVMVAAPVVDQPVSKQLVPRWLWAVFGLVIVAGLVYGLAILPRDGEVGGEGSRVAEPTDEPQPQSVIVVATPTSAPTLPPSSTATSVTQPTDTPSPTNTPTVMPTDTDTPLPTATPSPTSVPCPEPALRVFLSSVNVRSGPGSRYNVVDIALQDDIIPIIGRTESSSWYNVDFEGQIGWISATVVEMVTTEDCVEIPVAATIPPPPAPTATPVPTSTNTPVPISPPGGGNGGGQPPPSPTPAIPPTATPATPP